jgi:UPF0176 protein
MPTFTNAAAYKFAPLADLKPLRERLKTLCLERDLKGTVLLSTEGINLFVAGLRPDVDALLTAIQAIPGLEDLPIKFSESEQQPFTRMLVKIKKEIIAFGVDRIDPARDPAPKLSPRELKEWLDEGRPVTLLDTRNEFEIELGTFRNATRIGIAHFREFPAAVERLPEEMKQRTIVTYCTGGIRCEKAAPYLRKQGFANVLQLDGGILKYFEECGREHYDGECFVFDKRVGLDTELNESGRSLCYVCQSPLEQAERADPRYVEGVSCPRCYQSSEEKRLQELNWHRALLAKVTQPLPGSVPYENVRPLNVPGRIANRPMLDFLRDILPQYSLEKWRLECDAGRVLDSEFHPVSAARIVREGERYYHRQPLAAEPDVNADIRILHEDAAIIVVNKPAPLPVHPCGRFNKNTLQAILREVYDPQKPRPAHRLDANTTGITVFTRTVQFAKLVQSQFERGEVGKHYLARVIGHPTVDQFTCDAPIREAAGEAGSRDVDLERGLSARTDFRVIDRRSDGTSLVETIPLTGRTNQIRIHLWHLGHPILGDRTYLPGGTLGATQTLAVGDPPLCLHARRLSFVHPLTGLRTAFEADPPGWVS